MSHRKVGWPLAIALALALAWFGGSLIGQTPVQSAPLAAPTPIAQYAWNPQPRLVEFWGTATGLTTDTRSACHDLSGYNTLDLHYVIDQGTLNTTTLKLQFSNIDANYVDGVSVAAANVADASGLQQYSVFGRTVCLYADVTNSNAWTVTAVGLAK